MLKEWNYFYQNDVRDHLESNLQALNENEAAFRKFFLIEDIEDKVDDTLTSLLTLSTKHNERVEKMIKNREQKIKQASLSKLRNNVFHSPRQASPQIVPTVRKMQVRTSPTTPDQARRVPYSLKQS